MIIRRQTKPETNFYVLEKSISEDLRLSWAARGLLVYLLGKPDNWEVSVAHLIKQTERSGKHSRRDAVYGLLKEIEVAGYITREQQRKEGGGFEPVSYIVSEIPLTENTEASNQASDTENTAVTENTEAPLTENPDAPLPGSPDTANPTLISIENTTRTEIPPSRAEPGKPKSSKGTKIPDDFQVTDDMRQWFAEKQVPGDPIDVTEHFSDHHLSKGSVFKDWQAAWRTWCRNQVKFQRGTVNGNSGQRRLTPAERVYAANAERFGSPGR